MVPFIKICANLELLFFLCFGVVGGASIVETLNYRAQCAQLDQFVIDVIYMSPKQLTEIRT